MQLLRELPQGAVVDTVDFAARLDVKPGALHQLLANAVNLRLIKKVHIRGHHCVGWKLGPGNDSVTIERRKPAEPITEAELARRRAATARRRARADAKAAAAPRAPTAWGIGWPPGAPTSTSTPAPPTDDESAVADVDIASLPVWLRGLIASPAPEPAAAPAEPAPEQLQLFDAAEVGPGGRARWRRLDLMLPEPLQRRLREVSGWRQTTFFEG